MVMLSDSPYGKQRVTFSEITETSFRRSSESSQDGEQWTEVMRVEARRHAAGR